MFFDTENAYDVEHHILVTKQFLSSVHSITDCLYYGDGEKLFYLKKYNFVSLLRGMIDGKKNWTSGKYIHEGGIEGEGMVKELRPLLPNNLRKDFAVNLIKKIYNKNGIETFLSILKANHEPITNSNSCSADQYIGMLNNKCKIYDS